MAASIPSYYAVERKTSVSARVPAIFSRREDFPIACMPSIVSSQYDSVRQITSQFYHV
jgi:hypothetical protein